MKSFIETVKIREIVPTGQGIGDLEDGRKCFAWGALPGELVEVEITKKKKSYVEGFVIRVIEASSERVEPKDDCYLATSPWQIMNYDFELSEKASVVQKAFRMQKIEIEKPEVTTDFNEWNYRNKMEYSLYWDNDENKIKLAFHMRGSHRKIPISHSSIERKEILDKALEIIDDLNSRNEEARKYQAILLRANQNGEVSGGLLENFKPHPNFKELTDEILGREYSYSPNGFFQINLPVYEMALKDIAKEVSGDKVIDLYSGVGTIGLSVAGDREVILVESNMSAVREAEKNAKGISNAKVIGAKSEEVLDFITSDACVIVDPPRAGLDEKVVQKFLEILPPKIIYLSCNPITQARDVAMMAEKYEMTKIKAFNFFPKTPHIENLVILGRKK